MPLIWTALDPEEPPPKITESSLPSDESDASPSMLELEYGVVVTTLPDCCAYQV